MSLQDNGRSQDPEAISFAVLGPITARRDDTDLELGPPQQKALLALLLLNPGRSQAMAQILTALWGEEVPRGAEGTIRTYVSRLRRLLDDKSVLTLVGGGYALMVQPEQIDVGRVSLMTATARAARQEGRTAYSAQVLRSALALWRGEPLAGIRADFADAQRAALLDLRLNLVQDCLAAEVDSGQHREASAELTQLVRQNPLREGLIELLLLALRRSPATARPITEAPRAFHPEIHADHKRVRAPYCRGQ